MTPLPTTGTRIRTIVESIGGGLHTPPRQWFHRRLLLRGYFVSRHHCDAVLDGHRPPTDRFIRAAARALDIPASALGVSEAEWSRTEAWLAEVESALSTPTEAIICTGRRPRFVPNPPPRRRPDEQ